MQRLDKQLMIKMKCVPRFWKNLALIFIIAEILMLITIKTGYVETNQSGESYYKVGRIHIFVEN